MKFHRHAMHLGRENAVPPHVGFKAESGYMYCDLCQCKPVSGSAGDEFGDCQHTDCKIAQYCKHANNCEASSIPQI